MSPHSNMLIIGLTGSIAMGKSTVAKYFSARSVPVFDSDKEVHRLYEGAARAPLRALFPDAVIDGKVDREKLGKILSERPELFRDLEAVVHPMVRESQRRFLLAAAEGGAEMALLDIPLLFETNTHALVDVAIVVSAPKEIQKARLLERQDISEEKLKVILAKQMTDEEKRKHADFIVENGGTFAQTDAQIGSLIRVLKSRQGTALERWRTGSF